MKIYNIIPFFIFALSNLCIADHFTDVVPRMPACGVNCILNSIPASPCHKFANTTCLCHDDNLHGAVLQCVQAACTVLEAMETARLEAKACQRPQRSKQRDILAVISIEALAFFCVLLRLFSRWYTVAHFEMDDYIMIGAAMLYVPFQILGQIAAAKAFGVDIWTVDEASLTFALKLFYVTESLYLTIIALTKLSILCFYLRIFPNKMFRQLVFAVMAWVTVSGLIFIFLQVFQCTPISFNWEGWRGDYGQHRCFNVNKLVFTAAGFSIAQDVVILLMPLPLLAQLQTSWRVKLGAMLMFSLGIFVVITSCIRLRTIVLFARSTNPTWDYTDTLIWTGLECSVSIMVASLPAIRALVSRVTPKLFGSITKNGGASPAGRKGWESKSSGQHLLSHVRSTATTRTATSGDMRSQIELGDKTMGDVCTEIGAQKDVGRRAEPVWRPWDVDDCTRESTLRPSTPGIHVWTTTRTALWRN